MFLHIMQVYGMSKDEASKTTQSEYDNPVNDKCV